MTRGRALQWTGLVGILAVALARVWILFAPDVIFDVDPAIDPTPLGAAGPALSLALDAALLLASALALAGVVLDGRRLRWWMVVLVLLPTVPIVMHGRVDFGDMWRGTTWLAAMVAGVAASRLAADRTQRVILVSVLLAGLAPLAVRGAMQMSVEHGFTVAQFETHKETFLRDRGWEPDSSAARIYERRLRQPQPRGWFTTTNVLASLFACGAVALAGLAVAAGRAGRPSGWTGLLALGALVLAVGLFMSGSKGAILAAAGGFVLLAAPMFAGPRWGPALCLGLVLAAAAAVVVRGAALPEGFAGDRSLLFRWHYQVASVRVIQDAPWIGVGPDGFQQAYVAARVPRNPEEVKSAHSMPWDWIATLGLFGVAWIVVVAMWLWEAGRAPRESDDPVDAVVVARATGYVGLAALALATPLALWVELPTLDVLSLTTRFMGATLTLVLAPALAYVISGLDTRLLGWSLAAGAATLAAHAQIEMTFFSPGAVTWAVCFLAVASRGADDDRPGPGRFAGAGLALPALIALAAGALTVREVVPAVREHVQMRAAAALLQPFPEDRGGQLRHRRLAIAKLRDTEWSTSPRSEEAAVEQMLLCADLTDGNARLEQLAEAEHLALRLAENEHTGGLRALNLATQVVARRAMTTGRAADWDRAVELAHRRTTLDPHGLIAWRQLGDLLWASGDGAEAAQAYTRALEIDADMELDELKQLSERDRAVIEERAGGGGSAVPGSPWFKPL